MKHLFTLLCITFSLSAWADFEHFITRQGDKLMDGNQEFRFISFNIPNLHYVEDDLRFDRKMPFRFPDDYEIEDALQTINQMGGQVVRTYTLPVYKPNEPAGTPKYVLGPGEFNEEAFKTLDRVLAAANKHNIRLIIPIVNNFKWWGGAVDYAAFRGKQKDDFWTDPQLINDFKKTVHFLLTRVNTVTGVPYKDDKAILAWETGNETQCPHSWTKEITAYMKSLDLNHLVCDGYYTSVLRDESINDPNVDIVQTHHYEQDPRDMIDHIWQSAKKARGKKPYMLGEFGFISTEATRAVLDVTINEGLSGALIWSLRHHHREGGFFWHSEPSGGDFFKAYHWPGFTNGEIYDETNLMAMYREKAFQIQGLKTPPITTPDVPRLLPIQNPAAISWQGAVGASGYDVERSQSKTGPWETIGYNISDAKYQYRPLFNDSTAKIGESYYYRIRARNQAGVSGPSNVEGPIQVTHKTIIDEFQNESLLFHKQGKLSLAQNEARRYKEDIHRLHGEDGAWIMYKTETPMIGFALYAFHVDQDSSLVISVSNNGQSFTTIDPQVIDYSSAEGEYGYLDPMMYTASFSARFLKIEFKGKVALSRLEIGYAQ